MNPRGLFWLFNLVLLPLYPLLLLYTLWRRFIQKKSAASFRGQWGAVPAEAAGLQGSPIIWLHAVSVGETMAARPIARALKQEVPECRIVLSCTTDTGFTSAQAAKKTGEVDAVIYYPMDLPWPASRALRAINPNVFLTVETELWPNLIHLATAHGAHCYLANGRVSDSMLKSAPRLRWLWRWMLANLDAVLMRGEFDATRMRDLCALTGVSQTKVQMLGDVKLDEISTASQRQELRAKWRKLLGIAENELLWICGSTHPALGEGQQAEEEMALEIYRQLRSRLPMRLLLAPRHIERVEQVTQAVLKAGYTPAKRSEIDGSTDEKILVLDTVGELSEIYAAADIVFIGGSLVSRGGHNILEPVLRGVPVLYGPHMSNFRSAAQFVEGERLGEQVPDAITLEKRLEAWLTQPELKENYDERARHALQPHQGAARRIAQYVAGQLKSKG